MNYVSEKLNLKNDVVFKEFFSKKENEGFLKDFLSLVLNIKVDDIESISVQKESELSKDKIEEKYGRLDLDIVLNKNTYIDLEMQVRPYKNYICRLCFYSSKKTASQLITGDDYNKLKNIISISILDFILFKDLKDEYFHETVTILKNHRDVEFSGGQKFYFIELPKFRKLKKVDLENPLNEWLTFIDYSSKEGVDHLVEMEDKFKDANKNLEILLGNEELRRRAEKRLEAYLEYNTLIADAKAEVEEAKAQAREAKAEIEKSKVKVEEIKKKSKVEIEKAKGLGIKEGIESGKNDKAVEIAIKMKSKNIKVSEISEITGLSIYDINML